MAMTVEAVTKGLTREQWLKLRTKGIGGSDAAAVSGMNPWKSKVAVYLEKTGQIEQPEAGEAAEWGQLLEDVVARKFAEKVGLKIQRSNKLYRHPEHSFMLGNIDRLITDSNKRKGILEVKTTNAFNREDWIDAGNKSEEADRIPDHYAIQLQHYLAVLGLDYGFFAVLIGGNTFRYKYVERDETIIKYLIELEGRFWNDHVLKGIPPMVDGSDASMDLLNYLYPTSRPESSVHLGADAESIIHDLYEAQQEVKSAETRLDACKNQIKAMMQDAETAYFNGEKVFTWKSSERNSLDSKALKAKLPDVYEQFVKTTQTRTFLIK